MSHMRYHYQFTMSSVANPEEVRVLLGRLCEELSIYGVSNETCASAQIVLAEALNNISKHAYAGRADGAVEVRAEVGDKSLRFTLKDTGAAIPGPRLPRGRPQKTDVPLEDLPEGGFGWLLIRDLTTSVTYDHEDGENRLVLAMANT